MKDEGLIGAIGVGANSGDVLTFLMERVDLDVVLMAGRYTLLDRGGLPFLDLAARRGVPVVAAGVYNSGILADPQPGARFNYSEADPVLVARALQLRELCEAEGVPLRAAAIQFAARHPAVAAVLVGVRTPDEVDDAIAMAAHPIPQALWERLS
jgi:D-threo-aldose 1-dehydrogenase